MSHYDGDQDPLLPPLTDLSLEELVPKDNFYRRLDRKLDLSFVRDFVKECYASSMNEQYPQSARTDALLTHLSTYIDASIPTEEKLKTLEEAINQIVPHYRSTAASRMSLGTGRDAVYTGKKQCPGYHYL